MTESEKLPVLAVVGPTASGKTALGVMLAKQYHGEVISARFHAQIYQGWILPLRNQRRKNRTAYRII